MSQADDSHTNRGHTRKIKCGFSFSQWINLTCHSKKKSTNVIRLAASLLTGKAFLVCRKMYVISKMSENVCQKRPLLVWPILHSSWYLSLILLNRLVVLTYNLPNAYLHPGDRPIVLIVLVCIVTSAALWKQMDIVQRQRLDWKMSALNKLSHLQQKKAALTRCYDQSASFTLCLLCLVWVFKVVSDYIFKIRFTHSI